MDLVIKKVLKSLTEFRYQRIAMKADEENPLKFVNSQRVRKGVQDLHGLVSTGSVLRRILDTTSLAEKLDRLRIRSGI